MQVVAYQIVLMLVVNGCIFFQSVDGEECFHNQCKSIVGTNNNLDTWKVLSVWRKTLENSELCQDSLDSLEVCRDWSDERVFGGDMVEDNSVGDTITGNCHELGGFDSFGKVSVLEETECIKRNALDLRLERLKVISKAVKLKECVASHLSMA